jgi:amyloid beta precursor protein binding protein 1
MGSFTIVDQGVVTEADLGSNFFLSPTNLGHSKAESMIPLLLEMNEEVQGKFIQKVSFYFFWRVDFDCSKRFSKTHLNGDEKDPVQLIKQDPDFFDAFSMVICTNLTEKDILSLSEICWKKEIPLVVARIYGFYGYLRIAVPEHQGLILSLTRVQVKLILM